MEQANDNNFISVYDWMLNLNLKPLEVMVLAIINGFEERGQEYTGSADYIVKTLHVSKPTALKALNKLVKEGLLIKVVSHGRRASVYQVNSQETLQMNSKESLPQQSRNFTVNSKESLPQQSKNFTVNSKESLPDNAIYINNNKYNNINNNINTAAAAATARARARDDDPDFGEIMKFYSDNISRSFNGIEADMLKDWYDTCGKDWVLEAIREAVLSNAKNMRFISTVLTSWQKNGFKNQNRPKLQAKSAHFQASASPLKPTKGKALDELAAIIAGEA